MSRHTDRLDAAARVTSPELRAQLDELLAAFDEIAQYGRERRRLQQDNVDKETLQ